MVPLLLIGCLERVTGEFVPLDERYTAGHDAGGMGKPSGAEAGAAGGGPSANGELPYQGYAGDTLKIGGTIVGDGEGSVQIDVFEHDPTQPGGLGRKGAVRLPAPGAFELKVPAELAKLQLQVFQDPGGDGPSENDPYAARDLELRGDDVVDLELRLVVGQRGVPVTGAGSPVHTEAAPGAAGGSGEGGAPQVFPAGPKVKLSGRVSATLEGPIYIDLSKADPASPGGRSHVLKITVQEGEWSLEVPVDYGQIELDAYQDPKNDGPTEGDPIVHFAGNPLTVESKDLSGLDLVVP